MKEKVIWSTYKVVQPPPHDREVDPRRTDLRCLRADSPRYHSGLQRYSLHRSRLHSLCRRCLPTRLDSSRYYLQPLLCRFRESSGKLATCTRICRGSPRSLSLALVPGYRPHIWHFPGKAPISENPKTTSGRSSSRRERRRWRHRVIRRGDRTPCT